MVIFHSYVSLPEGTIILIHRSKTRVFFPHMDPDVVELQRARYSNSLIVHVLTRYKSVYKSFHYLFRIYIYIQYI